MSSIGDFMALPGFTADPVNVTEQQYKQIESLVVMYMATASDTSITEDEMKKRLGSLDFIFDNIFIKENVSSEDSL